MARFISNILICFSFLCFSTPCFAQEAPEDPRTKIAEFGAQLERLESQLQGIAGAAETQNVQIGQLDAKLERNYRDLEMRLNALEGRITLFQDTLNRAVTILSPKLAQEGQKFQAALGLVQQTQYAQAIQAFQQFIGQYPKSPQVGEAYFWIGECRFALKDYAQAIKDYQKFVEKHPKADKAPLAILKQGDAFIYLQMPEEAKVFFKKLISEHPSSNEAAQAKGKLAAIEQKKDVITHLPPPTPTKPESGGTEDF